jgi:hypothetical protein
MRIFEERQPLNVRMSRGAGPRPAAGATPLEAEMLS